MKYICDFCGGVFNIEKLVVTEISVPLTYCPSCGTLELDELHEDIIYDESGVAIGAAISGRALEKKDG